ncbi:MAG: hypothetical protein K8S13_01755 [Desulfobacula sp.]|uniref:Calx-beta domain-containing protein n=1 Tax=Desulfobacula sp. TaxID=2593537 RepID=UPI0025C41214|nr:Calx-beta domain-containing protein [Desulfobacula sp.]MCD4718573.1 hypothetical protein [Desulfobacula sp.]
MQFPHFKTLIVSLSAFCLLLSFQVLFADQFDQKRKQLAQLKDQHQKAKTILSRMQKKYPGMGKKSLSKAIDDDINKIEKGLTDLKLYQSGIKILSKEKPGPLEKGFKSFALKEINEKIEPYQLKINNDTEVFVSSEVYNNYIGAMTFVASTSSGFNIAIPKVTGQQVKIADLRKSGALNDILSNLEKAKSTGRKNIVQLKNNKDTISKITGLEKKIAALEKEIPEQIDGEKLKQIKIKSVNFEPSRYRAHWPDVTIGETIHFRLVVVYEDGTVQYDPKYYLVQGSNRLIVSDAKQYEIRARVKLFNRKKIYPVMVRVYGKKKGVSGSIGSPYSTFNRMTVKETDGEIKIPLKRIGTDKKTESATITLNQGISSAVQGMDFRLKTREVKWSGKDYNEKYIIVEILDDDLSEGQEEFYLIITSRTGSSKTTDHSLGVNIQDDERGGNLTFTTNSIDVDAGQDHVAVKIKRQGLSWGQVSVDFSTNDNTAKQGKDYTKIGKKIIWPQDKKDVKKIHIPILNNKRDKETSFWAVLKNPSGGAALGDIKRVRIKLLKGQPPPGPVPSNGPKTLGFEKLTYEFREDAGKVIILVQRSGDMSGPLRVNWKIYDANTDANQDYISNFGKLEWAGNDPNPKPISIEILDDSEPERLEHAYIELYNITSPGQTGKIAGQNPVKLTIIDNDRSAFEADEGASFCQSIKIIPNRLSGKPGQTFRLNQVFRVIALMDDNREVDVTRDPGLIWEPGIQYTFPGESKFNERLKVKVSFLDCRATARIDVEYPFWSAPISDAQDKSARAPKPPPDAWVWYVVCNKQYYNVVYTRHVDFTRHIVIAGPFPGPREPAMWIEENCPSAKCNKSGKCSQDTAVRGGPWGIYCNTKTGLIVVTKTPEIHHRKLADNFEALTEAQLWTDQHYPSWLCDHLGAYMENAFSELSSTVGRPVKSAKKKNDFAQIGGESTQKILQESSDATRMSHGGKKGFSFHNLDNSVDSIMGKEFREKRAAQKKEARQFSDEFLTRTTKDFYDYQKKRIVQQQSSKNNSNKPSGGIPTPETIPPPGDDSPDSGLDWDACIKKFCPICGDDDYSLMGVSTDSQCEDCKTKNKRLIDSCSKGGSAAQRPDADYKSFEKYYVYLCTKKSWNEWSKVWEERFDCHCVGPDKPRPAGYVHYEQYSGPHTLVQAEFKESECTRHWDGKTRIRAGKKW